MAYAPSSNSRYIAVTLLVEALGTAKTRYVAAPATGNVVAIYSASDTAVDGDNVITAAIAGTAITGGAATLTTANSVAGLVVKMSPTAANRVLAGQVLSVATDGGGGAGQARVTFVIEQD